MTRGVELFFLKWKYTTHSACMYMALVVGPISLTWLYEVSPNWSFYGMAISSGAGGIVLVLLRIFTDVTIKSQPPPREKKDKKK